MTDFWIKHTILHEQSANAKILIYLWKMMIKIHCDKKWGLFSIQGNGNLTKQLWTILQKTNEFQVEVFPRIFHVFPSFKWFTYKHIIVYA